MNTLTLEGFVDDLAEAEYHAHPTSLSQSGAKLLLKAPALYRHEQEHRTEKRAYDLGHYAHAKVLGVGAEVVALLRTDPKTGEQTEATDFKSPSVGQHAAELRAAGKIPLLRKEIDQVDAMANELAEHRMARRLLAEGRPEVSAFGIDEETGVMRRARFDWLGKSILSDYKTAETSEPNAFLRNAVKFGYHIQHPWYLQLAADLGHDAQAFAFIVQEKKAPYIVTVIELPQELVDFGARKAREALQRFRDCTESGVWPGYVPDDTFAQPAAPPWLLRDQEYSS